MAAGEPVDVAEKDTGLLYEGVSVGLNVADVEVDWLREKDWLFERVGKDDSVALALGLDVPLEDSATLRDVDGDGEAEVVHDGVCDGVLVDERVCVLV